MRSRASGQLSRITWNQARTRMTPASNCSRAIAMSTVQLTNVTYPDAAALTPSCPHLDDNGSLPVQSVPVQLMGRRDSNPVTLATVAAAPGVSRMTVSNAYNRPDQLSPALREKVLTAARELGYGGPGPGAREPKRRWAGA